MSGLDPAQLLAMRPRLAPKTKLRLDPKTGKHILLYPEKGLLLNPTGTAILQQCNGEQTLSDIIVVLAAQFQTEPQKLQAEVLAFVQGLFSERGLLTGGRVTETEGRSWLYTLIAELTYLCPLRCPYCSNPTQLAQHPDRLQTADWLRVFQEAAGARRAAAST